MKYKIIIESDEITIDEVYNNLVHGCKKIINNTGSVPVEYSWFPNNKIECVALTPNYNDILFDDIYDCPQSLDDFIKKYPAAGWFYGYIDD